MTLGLVLEPRYKTQYVEFAFSKLYGVGVASSSTINGVHDKLRLVYDMHVHSTILAQTHKLLKHLIIILDLTVTWLLYLNGNSYLRIPQTTELENHLKDSINHVRNILVVSIPTIALELAFNLDHCIIEDICSSLKSDIVEAIMC